MSSHDKAALADIAFGALSALGIGALMIDAADLDARAKMFPDAVLWCLLIAALATLGEGIVSLRRPSERSDTEAESQYLQFIVPSLVMIAAGGFLLAFGFYLTAPLLIFAMHTLHTRLSTGAAPTLRSLTTGAVLALVATAAMYLIFAVMIGLPAPSGSLF